MNRRNLVICRAGRNSLHPRWVDVASSRNWDLIVSTYHDDAPLTGDEIFVHRFAGAKMPGLADIFARHWDLVARYERIWLPDDDLDVGQATIDRMFELASQHDLALFQPALTRDSFMSWVITLQHAGFALRFTNFTEIMAPAFTTPLLAQLRDSFSTSVLGWGLDFFWPRFTQLGQTAIIDATPVRHTRPVGGTMRWAGFATEAERSAAVGRWTARYIPDINWRMAINFGGITTESELLSYSDDGIRLNRFLAALEAGIAGVQIGPHRRAAILTEYIKTHQAFGQARNKVGLFQGIATVLAERQQAASERGIAARGD
jgi:hypothetical protein